MSADSPRAWAEPRVDAVLRPGASTARRWTLALEAFTAVGAFAGVQGFLSGAFDDLVGQLTDNVAFIEGPMLPASALGLLVGIPHAATVALGLRHHPRAPTVGLAAGSVLLLWVGAQLPLIGWNSPVQWSFLAVGLGECTAAATWVWRRGVTCA